MKRGLPSALAAHSVHDVVWGPNAEKRGDEFALSILTERR